MNLFTFISERFKRFFSGEEPASPEEPDQSKFFGREKTIAFTVTVIIALCLWFIVNLSRDFNVTLEVPIRLVNLPEDVALSSDLPEYVSVNLTGEGWKLIPIYNNPPQISLSAESQQINLFEQMRNQVGAFSDLNVLQVDPIMLNIETEQKTSKRVPIVPRVDLQMRSRYGTTQEPGIAPDSVTITGAQSKVEEIEVWETDSLELRDVHRSQEREIELQSPESGIILEPSVVTLRVDVAEFTEAEVRVPIRTRNLPSGEAVSYNPSSITVRYDVPIEHYAEAQNTRPFTAYVDYEAMEDDTTGFITPQIENNLEDINVRLRSFRPSQVSYFNIIPD